MTKSRPELTQEESLRLKKLLARLEDFLSREERSSLSLYILRKNLNELVHPLSATSRTKELIFNLLILTAEPAHIKKGEEEILKTIEELKGLYNLRESGSVSRQTPATLKPNLRKGRE